MSDDVTDLAKVLAAHTYQTGPSIRQVCRCGWARPDRRVWHDETLQEIHRAHVAEQITPLIADARLIGAATAHADAIAAYAELVERVEGLLHR